MPKLGPDGTFPLGGPVRDGDRGGLYAGLHVIKERRALIMDFGSPLSWVALPRNEAKAYAQRLRSIVWKAFGKLPYNKSELPIRVIRNADMIELHFPQTVGILAANPELWLALAEVIEDVAK